jgi:hypothetical protein
VTELTVRARTEEPSSARVRILFRMKAPRFFQRCRPSWGGIRGESLAGATRDKTVQALSHVASATRVSETPREGNARYRLKNARLTFARAISTRSPVLSTQVEHGARKPS